MFTLASERAIFVVGSAESAVLVQARSTVGPIVFGSLAASGHIDAFLLEGALDTCHPTAATLEIPVASLTSGNSLYDSELRSRLDARRFPEITAELCTISDLGCGRFDVTGNLTIQGTTRKLSGGLELSLSSGIAILAGTQVIDIREFAIPLPRVLMLRIYPDVTVRFRIQAVRQAPDQVTGRKA